MNIISEFIFEITCVILFAIGMSFLLLINQSMIESNDIVNQDVRTKLTIQEGDGYVGKNVIDGTSMYYDIIETGTDYPIFVNGAAISASYINEAEKGNGKALLSCFTLDAKYEKSYAQDASGNITQVIFNQVAE